MGDLNEQQGAESRAEIGADPFPQPQQSWSKKATPSPTLTSSRILPATRSTSPRSSLPAKVLSSVSPRLSLPPAPSNTSLATLQVTSSRVLERSLSSQSMMHSS